MLYNQQANELRQFIIESYKKFQLNETLLPLQKQIVDVLLIHPEYHSVFLDREMVNASFASGPQSFFAC